MEENVPGQDAGKATVVTDRDRSGASLLPWLLVAIMVLAGLAAYRWQQQKSAQAAGDEADRSPAASTAREPLASPQPPASSDVRWQECRIPGLALPVPAKVLVVDGRPLQPVGAVEGMGRAEQILQVEITEPGPVALLLTNTEPAVWMLRPSRAAQLAAVVALGDYPQRINGAGRTLQLSRSTMFGADCGRSWLKPGAGVPIAEVARQVYGKPHEAVFVVVDGIGVAGPARAAAPPPVAPVRQEAIPEAAVPPRTPAARSSVLPGQAGLVEALRKGQLRPGSGADLARWKGRYGEVMHRWPGDVFDERTAHMNTYVIQGDFEIPGDLSGANAVIFILEPRVPFPRGDQGHSPILDLGSGACIGALCGMILE